MEVAAARVEEAPAQGPALAHTHAHAHGAASAGPAPSPAALAAALTLAPAASAASASAVAAREWALVTPDMLVGALARAGGRRRRRGRDGSAVRSVARCLAERYPVCPCRPALLHEIRLKLQCCVQVGILRRDGDWFVPMSAGAGPSRAQLASFWQLYLAATGQEGAAAPRTRGSRQSRPPSPPPPPPPPPPVHYNHHPHHQPGPPPPQPPPPSAATAAATAATAGWPAHAPPPPIPPTSPWPQTHAPADADSDDGMADADDEQRLASLDLAEPRGAPRASRSPPPPSEEPGAEPEPPAPRLLPPPPPPGQARGRARPAHVDSDDGSDVWEDPNAAPGPRPKPATGVAAAADVAPAGVANAAGAPRHTDPPRAPASSSALPDTGRHVDLPPRPRSPTPPIVATAAGGGRPMPLAALRRRWPSPLRPASAPPEDHPGRKVTLQRTPKLRPQARRRRGRR